MYSKFYIKNYKCIKELELKSLSRINLISGKNNTGKSSILEALYIYANKGIPASIFSSFNIQHLRLNTMYYQEDTLDTIALYESIFYNREFKTEEEGIIISFDDNPLYLYLEDNGTNPQRTSTIYDDEESVPIEKKLALIIKHKDDIQKIRLNRPLRILQQEIFRFLSENKNSHFIHTGNIERDTNSLLFDNLALTDGEKMVVEALRIIEPRAERIAFVEKYGNTRTPIVKLKGEENTILLNSMGDGINRILTIILALINSKDGFLLIDELENGLHYSVQEKLWEIIFKISSKMNVRVFVTTHSNDCIRSFSSILNRSPKNKVLGSFSRLDFYDDKLKQVVFSPEEIDIAIQNDIEIR